MNYYFHVLCNRRKLQQQVVNKLSHEPEFAVFSLLGELHMKAEIRLSA